jgi:hypothetical protein
LDCHIQFNTIGNLKQFRSIITYDSDWKLDDNTEQFAFLKAAKYLPKVQGATYFGFPWATLFEFLESDRKISKHLMTVLSCAKPLLKKNKFVITVCQHPNIIKFQNIVAESAVTHVFCPHTSYALNCLPGNRKVRILPFPIAPIHAFYFRPSGIGEKKYLYSFAEPKTQMVYLTETRDSIIRHLGSEKRGLVISRQQWDFENIVSSQFEVHKGTQLESQNRPVSLEPWRILQESIFSLCPDILSVNSTRLWDSIGYGVIPVIFSDFHSLPGCSGLWEEATVFCSNRLEDILALPDQLEALASDQRLLDRKRHALRQLWLLYGPDCFIYDIQKLFQSLVKKKSPAASTRIGPSYCKLLTMASLINQRKPVDKLEFDFFILECSNMVLSDPSGFLHRFQENVELRSAYKQSIMYCNPRYFDAMQRNLAFKSVSLN